MLECLNTALNVIEKREGKLNPETGKWEKENE